MASPEILEVALGERSYPIHVVAGELAGLGSAMAAVLPPERCFVVSNPLVAGLYEAQALASLRAAGFLPTTLRIPDGERYKNLETWSGLVSQLLDARIDRRCSVIALGGGVTGDLVGYAAASVLRGVPFVQVPTTLLAMVDSSVGGKTGVNTAHGKNLVGAFYQPRMVYAATGVLATLERAEWRCGFGEAIKHGVIRDAEFFGWMERQAAALRKGESAAVAQLVRRCCQIKAQVVEQDERESGLRAILNFGHTAGHALETALGYGSLRHGEAVGIGMLAELSYARERSWCLDEELAPRLRSLMRALDLPRRIPDLAVRDSFAKKLLNAAAMDKKTVRGTLSLVVPVRLGEVRLTRIPQRELAGLLEKLDPTSEEP